MISTARGRAELKWRHLQFLDLNFVYSAVEIFHLSQTVHKLFDILNFFNFRCKILIGICRMGKYPVSKLSIDQTPKRRVHVVWAVKHESQLYVSTCGRDEEKENQPEKSPEHIFHVCVVRMERFRANLAHYGDIADGINHAKFQVDWWRGLHFMGCQN